MLMTSLETRQKMRLAKLKNPTRYWLGKKNPMKEETKRKISLSQKGKPKPWLNNKRYPLSEETKMKIGLANQGINNGMFGRRPSEETLKKMSMARIGKKSPMFGKKHSKETKIKMSKIQKGRKKPWLSILRKGKHLSEETKRKISIKNTGHKYNIGRKFSDETKKKISEGRMGDKNWMWKGGITPINQKIRTSLEYSLWRKSVFERDNYTCIWCGYKDKDIHADHIKRFSDYPELRLAIDNGRTLCVECHRKTDTWGNKKI